MTKGAAVWEYIVHIIHNGISRHILQACHKELPHPFCKRRIGDSEWIKKDSLNSNSAKSNPACENFIRAISNCWMISEATICCWTCGRDHCRDHLQCATPHTNSPSSVIQAPTSQTTSGHTSKLNLPLEKTSCHDQIYQSAENQTNARILQR